MAGTLKSTFAMQCTLTLSVTPLQLCSFAERRDLPNTVAIDVDRLLLMILHVGVDTLCGRLDVDHYWESFTQKSKKVHDELPPTQTNKVGRESGCRMTHGATERGQDG